MEDGKKQALEKMPALLLAWYDQHARVLPWREDHSAYRVWISEIMLQQTRVEAVKPYFERFLEAFPSVLDLAEAPEERVLKLWEGLGYYTRARNLKRAAEILREQYQGNIPADRKKLKALPGIGEYTAGAIASIAFGIKTPAVDGNVLRVISRITEDDGDILDTKVKKKMTEALMGVMPEKRAGDFNQALMELGAVVCIPNGIPKCSDCPISALCMAHQHATEGQYPYKSPKKARKIENRLMLLIVNKERIALRKRPNKGLLAGLWEIPSMEGVYCEAEIQRVAEEMQLTPARIKKAGDAKHIFTHIEWRMQGCIIETEQEVLPEGFLYVTAEEMEKGFALPSAFRYYQEVFLEGLVKNEFY